MICVLSSFCAMVLALIISYAVSMALSSQVFTLKNFEGPLDLLWHLINSQEIDIYQILIAEVTQQYLSQHKEFVAELDRGAEFIALAASLAWFKSKVLLPKHEQQEEQNLEEELDPHFDIIHQLIDYSRFKQAAKILSERELQQEAFYPRGIESIEGKKNLGIDHISLDDLATLFQQILAKTAPKRDTIQEEEWKVSDKIHVLCKLLEKQKRLEFHAVFHSMMSRLELIVIFLALLEMMKCGQAIVVHDLEKKTICILATSQGV